MIKQENALFLLILLFAVPCGAQDWSDWLLSFFVSEDFPCIENPQTFVGEGGLVQEERDLSYFDSINVHESISLILRNTVPRNCVIESDVSLISVIKTEVKNKTLWIYPIRDFSAKHQPLILIAAPYIRSLKAASANHLRLGSGSFIILGSESPKYQRVQFELESGDLLYVLTSEIEKEVDRLKKYITL